MLKRYLIATIFLSFVVTGCTGCGKKEGAVKDVTDRPGSGTTQTDMGNGDAERPDSRDVTAEDEAIRRMQTIYFDFDKYNLLDAAKRALESNATIMKDNPGVSVTIEGHCDERGTNEYNLALGERRAQAARDYLVRLGVTESRMMIRSYGEERPADPRHNEEAWAKNRRAQFERRY